MMNRTLIISDIMGDHGLYDLIHPDDIMAFLTARAKWLEAGLDKSATGILLPPLYYETSAGIASNASLNDGILMARDEGISATACGVVEPKFGGSAYAEIDRLAVRGASAVVWSARAQGVFANDELLCNLVRHAHGAGLVSLIYSFPYSINEALWRLWALAAACEACPVIIVGALSSWENIQMMLADPMPRSNVFYDTAGITNIRDLEMLVDKTGSDRFLAGLSGLSDRNMLNQIESGPMSASAREDIMWRNAARLFGLEERGGAK